MPPKKIKTQNDDNIYKNILIFSTIILVLLTGMYLYLIIKQKQLHKTEKYEDKPKIEIVYLYNSNCPFCIKFNPIFESVVSDFVNKTSQLQIEIKKISQKQMSDKYKIYVNGFPTVLIFLNGNFITKSVGYKDENEFERFLNSV